MGFWFEGYETRRRSQAELESAPSEVLGATARQAFSELPVPSLVRSVELAGAELSSPAMLDQKTARQRIKDAGLEGRLTVPEFGINGAALDILMERKRAEVKRQEVMSRSPGGFGLGAAQLGTAFATSLLDPVNVGLAFVPVVGQARYMRYLAGANGILGRTAVRAGVGAVEGAAGAAIIEPLVLAAKTQEQADYDFTDSLLNVAFGTVFGGGLHVLSGAGADAYRALRGSDKPALAPAKLSDIPDSAAARVDGLPLAEREAALRTAAAQAIEGRAVDIEAIVPRVPDEEIVLQRQITEMLAAREAELVSITQSQDALAVTISGDAQQAIGDFQRAVDERDRLASEIARLPDGEPRRAQLIERQVRAQQLVDSRRISVDRLNRVRSAESDLEQLRYSRGAAKSIDEMINALPSAQQAPLRRRLEQARSAGEARPAGATLADIERPAPTPDPRAIAERQVAPESQVTSDVRASEAADRQLAERPPADDPIAEQEALLADQLAELNDVARVAGIDLSDELAEFDEAIALAESYGKAARAAVLCGMGH